MVVDLSPIFILEAFSKDRLASGKKIINVFRRYLDCGRPSLLKFPQDAKLDLEFLNTDFCLAAYLRSKIRVLAQPLRLSHERINRERLRLGPGFRIKTVH